MSSEVNPLKRAAASVLRSTGMTALSRALHRSALRPFIRVLYYHDVPVEMRQAFSDQLIALKEAFVPASRADLERLLSEGHWPHQRPGIIVTFDDGLRSHSEVVAPILEQLGYEGWFFVPVDLVTSPAQEHPALASRHGVLHGCDTARDPRVFMTVEQLVALSQRHNIGCHTASHVRLSDDLTEGQLQLQIVSAKQRLEAVLGRAVDSFSWVGGEEWAYSPAAARCIARHFEYAFSTNTRVARPGTSRLMIDRTHVEAFFPQALVSLQVSGLMDLYYRSKRKRIASRFAPPSASDMRQRSG
jgi:peptidoglycan/xylan/chitin deacetylase (PgdA/CDA1 family)